MSDINFFSLSSLLCTYQYQQDPEPHNTTNDKGTISSDDDDENEPSDENDSIMPHELSIPNSKEKQLSKFLDCIAETFSRTKSIPLAQLPRHERRQYHNAKQKGKGAGQVSASGLVMAKANQQPTVYIAKNTGTDEEDKQMADTLKKWIGLIASTGRRPSINKDHVWTKLVEYNKQRLGVYARQIEAFPAANISAVFTDESHGAVQARDLHSKSIEYKTNNCTETLQTMVSIAYELRYEETPTSANLSAQNKRWRTSIYFLGRLRAAYETFKETAIQFSKSFPKLDIVCLPAPNRAKYPKPEVLDRIQALAKETNMSNPTIDQIRNFLGQGQATRIYEASCHAEIQLLLHLEDQSRPDTRPFSYLGCSKKSCWLCHQFLSHYNRRKIHKIYTYETRASHGRIYPLWHIDLPTDPLIVYNIYSTLLDVQDLMRKLLRAPRTHRQAQAESSANLTVRGTRRKKHALAEQRILEASKPKENLGPTTTTLKDFVCSKQCLRIPASGDPPHLLSINFYNHPDGYPGCEPWNWLIPDFGALDHWHTFNFERVSRRLRVDDYPDINGDYLLYWCRNSELEPNRCMMSFVDIEVEDLSIGQQFWNGDVFITRFHEDTNTFKFSAQDVPRSILACGGFKTITNWVKALWEDNELEDEFLLSRQVKAMDEKNNADKEIIYRRMSKNERRVVKKNPEILAYLAIAACDDGAMSCPSVCKSDTPGMVRVTADTQPPAMEQIGWRGFSSDDL